MKETNYKLKRIRAGKYEYRGIHINCIGYYNPEHRVCWEAIDEYGCGFAHAYSLKECKNLVDIDLDKFKKLKI